jgi:hypothetical protein
VKLFAVELREESPQMPICRNLSLLCLSILLSAGWEVPLCWGQEADLLETTAPGDGVPPLPAQESTDVIDDVMTPALAPEDAVSVPPHCRLCGTHHQGNHGSRGIFRWFYRKHCWHSNDLAVEHYEPPVGTLLNAIMDTQIGNGEAAQMVLYRFDFLPGDSRLSRRGKRQLSKIGRRLARNIFPLLIEPTPGKPALDKVRRAHVVGALKATSIPVPEERVVIDVPPARGLDGEDAIIIYLELSGAKEVGGAGSSETAGTGADLSTPAAR